MNNTPRMSTVTWGNAPAPPSTAEVAPSNADQVYDRGVPVVLTAHPSGQGTDDPFAVFPSDIEIGYGSPVTTMDQLVTGEPNAGRRFIPIENDPGLVTSLNHVFGPARQTIQLRPQFGGDARDYRTAAIDHLIFEGILTAATILTPGPLDDMAAAGLRGGATGLASKSTFPRKTLRGVSLKWLERNKPKGWKKVPTRDNEGWIWKDANGVERLRFMRATGKNPVNNQWSRQANGYFRWQNEAAESLDIDGNVRIRGTKGFDEATHIMYEGPL